MKFILAEKREMTQKFADNGAVVPVTRLIAGPCLVTQVKTAKTDGYTALQLGFGSKKKLSKPMAGHLKKLGNFRYTKEFRIAEDKNDFKAGDKISVKIFAVGDTVQVTGVSKGRGFQGVVKRHGFHGSPATHGHKDQNRMPGSIAAGGPQHVFKGTRMAGRMGGDQVTVKNLKVVEVNPAANEIFIRGAVPGPISNLILISGEGDLITAVEEIKPVTEAVEAETKEIPEPAAEAETAEKIEDKAEAKEEEKK